MGSSEVLGKPGLHCKFKDNLHYIVRLFQDRGRRKEGDGGGLKLSGGAPCSWRTRAVHVATTHTSPLHRFQLQQACNCRDPKPSQRNPTLGSKILEQAQSLSAPGGQRLSRMQLQNCQEDSVGKSLLCSGGHQSWLVSF